LFGDVGLVPGRVRRGRVSVDTCSVKSVYTIDVFGDVGVVSGRVRQCRLSVGTCSTKSC